MARLGPPQNPPKEVYMGPLFLHSFPSNEAHKLFFWGPEMAYFGWGAKRLCREKLFLVLFCPLRTTVLRQFRESVYEFLIMVERVLILGYFRLFLLTYGLPNLWFTAGWPSRKR